MNTPVNTIHNLLPVDAPDALRQAQSALAAGNLVVAPTDTVYGILVDPQQPAAVERVFQVKGRDASKPLQIFLAAPELLSDVAVEVPEVGQRVAARFLPGGLTLVLKRRTSVPAYVVAGGDTVGVRVPDHPVILALLRAFGRPLAATSANRSGQPSPVTAQEAAAQVGGEAALVLDGGSCPVGRESTVLDCSGPRPRLLRQGAISRQELEAVIGTELLV